MLPKRTRSGKEVELLDWYRKSVDETARTLGTDTVMGLTAAEAASRLEKHGPNALRQAKKRTIWQMYLAQFKDVMVLVLLAAALVKGKINAEEAFRAAFLDELWQAETWGADEEAENRRQTIKNEICEIEKFLHSSDE